MTVNNGVVTAKFQAVKVFSATKHQDRERLGETISGWLRSLHAEGGDVASTVVTQSSDAEFHCITITMFYGYPKKAA